MSYRGYLIIFITLITLFRLWYIWQGPLDLSPDEAHYWEWSRRLDWSYYSKPPMVAYIIALFTGLGGNNEFSVRLGAVIISVIVTLLLYVIAKDIFQSERAALSAAILPNLTPLYTAGSILMTTDPLLILFWGVTIFLLWRALTLKRLLYWYLAGISTGLGLLSKYTMFFIYPSILLYLIFSREDRFWLRRKEPYIAGALSLWLFSPVILWNAQHKWVTVRHMMGQAHIADGLRVSIGSFFEFIGSQAGVLTPLIFFGLLYSIWRCGRIGFKEMERAYLFLFFTSAPVLAFFLLKAFQGKVQANWAVPAYFTAFIATAGVYDRIYRTRGVGIKVMAIAALLLGGFITALSYDTRLIRHVGIDPSPRVNPTSRLIGWEELGNRVGVVIQEMSSRPVHAVPDLIRGKEGDDTFIFSDTYQVASELAFYLPGNPTTYNINLGRRMNQYDLWPGFYGFKGMDGLYVKWGEADLDKVVKDNFERCEKEPTFYIYRNGRTVRGFTIFRCYNFKGMKEEKGERY